MAIQGFTTGAQGLLMMAPVTINNQGVASLVSAVTGTNFPETVRDLYDTDGNLITSKWLELAVFSSRSDQVGIISSAPNFDASPKTMAFTIDRDDMWSQIFLNRYCVSLRAGLETPADITSTTAKEYEDAGAYYK